MKTMRSTSKIIGVVIFASLLANSTWAQSEKEIAWQRAVINGSSDALVELALFYSIDPAKGGESRAADLLIVAAHRFEQSIAQVNLGVLYQFGGEGVQLNLSRAAYWYARAAAANNSDALVRLGDLYSRGIGTDVDYIKAARLYEQAANNGFPEAQVELGYLFEMGYLGEVDFPAAMDLYLSAAENGNFIAQYNLAEMYELGKGVAINLEQARKWYGLSAEQGLQEAQDALERLQ